MANILVVDDNPNNIYLMVSLLGNHQHTVQVAMNGREALELAQAKPPDLAVSDILMPVMDGFSLCHQWMQDARLQSVPFIFHTATYTEPEDIQFGLSLGARRFVTKPIDVDSLLSIIEAVLAEQQTGSPFAPEATLNDEPVYLKVYNERLINRLEHKMLEVEAANRRLNALLQASSRLSVLGSEEELIAHALETITTSMGYTRAHFFHFDQDAQVLRYLLGVGEENEISRAIRRGMTVALGESRGLVGLVAEQREPLIVADTAQEPRWVMADPTIRSALLAPVFRNGELYGVCTFVSTQSAAFDADDMRNAMILTTTLAIAVENSRLYQQQVALTSHLEELVAQRTADLAVALEQAQEADRLKTQFIADINHELRTPLTSISLYLYLLPQVGEIKRNEIIEVMQRETKLLREMIEELLDLSRLDLHEMPIHFEPIHIRELFDRLLEDRSQPAQDKGLALTLRSSGPDVILGDEKLLYHLFSNLLVNAIQYTDSGAISITCAADEDRGYTIAFADTGVGIPEEEIPHLFKRFFRGEIAKVRGIPGTGLGLSICHEIVQRHGGHITVASTVGEGTTLTVWLPRSRPDKCLPM